MSEPKQICPDCKGNGFIRVPYEQAREEVHAQCDTCISQGEVYLPIDGLINLKNQVDQLKLQKKFLQSVCKRAGQRIKELEQAVDLKINLERVQKQYTSDKHQATSSQATSDKRQALRCKRQA